MTSRIPEPESRLEEEGIPDQSDALPGKIITGDAQEDLEPPHDYPVAVEDYGTTAAEQRAGEPLDLRLGREQARENPCSPESPLPGGPGPSVCPPGRGREGRTNKDQDLEAHAVGS